MTQFVSSDRCKSLSLRVRLSILLVVSAVWLLPATTQRPNLDSGIAREQPFRASEGQVVLFAGLGDSGALDHSWVWNGIVCV
jgi:hypothetical protein